MGKILILGGAGFIGSNLARSLVQAGADVRIFTRPTAGPGQHSWRVQGIVAVAIGCLLRQQPLKLYGTGSAVRDYIYISDVVDAMILAAQQPGSSIANISSGQGHSVLEIVEKIESIAGRTIVKEFIAERPNDVEVNILDNRRARDLYGWVPRCSLHAGLATTLEFMQRSEFSVT